MVAVAVLANRIAVCVRAPEWLVVLTIGTGTAGASSVTPTYTHTHKHTSNSDQLTACETFPFVTSPTTAVRDRQTDKQGGRHTDRN